MKIVITLYVLAFLCFACQHQTQHVASEIHLSEDEQMASAVVSVKDSIIEIVNDDGAYYDSILWKESYNYGPLIDSVYKLSESLCVNLPDSDYWTQTNIFDSLMMTVIYPKPDVFLSYSNKEEKQLAERVQCMYDDFLETHNYLHNVESERDFFALYCSEEFCGFIEFASDNDYPPTVCPFTDGQGHSTQHLHKVEVVGMNANQAAVWVTFGTLSRDGIVMSRMKLDMCKERGDWFVNDFIFYVSFVESLKREMREGGMDV